MSSALRVAIGIDPGPVPGFAVVRCIAGTDCVGGRFDVMQCSVGIAPELFETLLGLYPATPTVVQIEKFVVGRRAGRSSTPAAGEVTRELIGALREVWSGHDSGPDGRLGGRWFERSAANVKPWATDARLGAAGLLDATKGMRHSRDAARHALFAAVHDGGIPDPLSKRSNR